jgi:hypothetical protein
VLLIVAFSVRGEVLVGKDALELDRLAASELSGYLSKLFTDQPNVTFLVGNPETNDAIAKDQFPKVSDQGVVLKSIQYNGHPAIIVGGGSPRATLWAVYDLVERWGVRYLLHGDVLPAKRAFEMPKLDVVKEPTLRVRQWRVLNEHAMGPISWGIADYKPVIDQLAKLRFNRLLLYIWPGQPFLPLEYKGIRQTSGTLFFGNHYPITPDMIGRSLFGNGKEYWNPDIPPPGSDPAKITQAAVAHVRNLIDYAHARGMECVMPANLTEFPKEFKPLLAHTKPVDMVGTPTIGPGPDADVDDPVLTALASTVLQTTIKTYPGVEYIALDLPEWREWINQYERAWKALDGKYHIAEVRSLHDVLDAAANRKDYPGGADRAVKEVKADIVALYFFDRVLAQSPLDGRKLVMSTVAEELYPILAKILPKGSETLNFVDYTPSRIVKRREVLKGIPAKQLPSVLIYTLHDDNVGVLPQLATHSLAELTHDIRAQGWEGFSTRYWLIGDHDPCVAYLSRTVWDAKATPEEVYRDQVTRVCGEACVDDMLKVFSEVEAATVTLEWNGLGLTFTDPSMMMKHWSAGELSAELKSVTPRYQAAQDAAKRALARSSESGKPYVNYWIGRLQFGIDYMNAIEAVKRAGTCESKKDVEGAIREGSRAIELMKHALEAYVGVARDRSDKGAIAVMNEYVLRKLVAKVEALRKVPAKPQAAVKATDFVSHKIYQSKERPSYTSWASFFPGSGDDRNAWYLGFVEITKPKGPTTRATTQFVYEMSLPRGYDTSKHHQELVLLKSTDEFKSWKEVGRETVYANGGAFAEARTPDGVFHRFVWAAYSRDPSAKPDEIYYRSHDGGKTWEKQKPFVSDRFVWYPHRMRTLRDGTLVLCCPRASKWGKGTDYPIRASMKLDVVSDMEMMLFFSHDQGKTWSNPLPIYSGQTVSETDFVELPDGNLLFINSNIFATPGRQFVYRDGDRFTPGPLERVHSGTVPETVCLTEDGVLVGCMRPGTYSFSTDLGQNWQPLEGAPSSMEVYQPWIQYLGHGKVACAGHYGADDPIGGRDQYIALHTFNVQTLHKTTTPKLWIERAFDDTKKDFLNRYTITLKANDKPLADKQIEVWYVARDQPGYDSYNSKPLAERMKLGGKTVTLTTNDKGEAQLNLPEFDNIESIHASYQMVIRFNADHHDKDYNSAQLPQLEYYANSGIDP